MVRGLAPRMQRTPRRRQHSRACIANTSTALSGLWGGAVRQGDGHNEALPLAPVARSAAEARPRGSPFPVRSREAPRSRAACHRGPPHGTDGPQHTHAGLSRVTAPAAAGWASPAGRASSAAWPQPGVVVEFEQRSMETDRRLSAAADRRPAVTSRISRKRVHRRRFHTCTLNRTMLWAAASWRRRLELDSRVSRHSPKMEHIANSTQIFIASNRFLFSVSSRGVHRR